MITAELEYKLSKASELAHKTRGNWVLWVGIGLPLLIWGLYHNVAKGWWRFDDPQILKHAFEYSTWAYFTVPSVWQKLSIANFTPWVSLSFDLDLSFFGLNPSAFYVHYLIILWLAAGATFFLLRLWLTTFWSVLGSALFIIGTPVAITVQQLMARHYLEGLLFSIISLYLYILSLRKNRIQLALASSGFYLLAVSAKEIYLPLVVLFPFLPELDLRKRLHATAPSLVVAVFYLLWRWYMLETVFGGYGQGVDWAAVLYLPHRAGKLLFGDGIIGMASLLAVCALLGMSLWRRVTIIAFAVVLCVSTVGPIIPVAAILSARYLLVIWWVLAIMIVLVLGRINFLGRNAVIIKCILYALIMWSILSHARQTVLAMNPVIHRFETQGRFIWAADGQKKMMFSPVLSKTCWYISGLLWMKKRFQGKIPHFRVLADEIELAELHTRKESVWVYEVQCQCMQDVSETLPRILEVWKERVRDKPLSIQLDYSNNTISWHFDPYENGKYMFLSPDDKWGVTCKTPVSQSGQFRGGLLKPVSFFLRYDSPEGWVTYSPLIHLSSPSRFPFTWRR